MRPVSRFLLFLILPAAVVCCRRDVREADISGIELSMTVERFDRELFGADPGDLETEIGNWYREYGDFFDVFNVHVIRIGPASSRHYPAYLSMFINDPTNREVFDYTREVFDDMEAINRSLTRGFRHYLYHFPDSSVPRVVGYVSRFNQGLLTVGKFVGVGLDQYLGTDCPYYPEMGVPRYLVRNKRPERIPVDVMMAWATQVIPYNDSVDNVLNRMIHKGLLAFFVHAMYPASEEGFLMGFTDEQMGWCRNNEEQMWTYLVEQKLLFSSDPLVIRKLTEDAPHTSYFTTESPGRAAVWVGWQIVRAYAERHPRLSVSEIVSVRDYQQVLRRSGYHPD